MFLDFFLLLKDQGIPVSIGEYLTLLEALSKDLAQQSLERFYYLCRTILIKQEQHLDDFDRLFGLYFQGMEHISEEDLYNIPEDWLTQKGMRHFSEAEKQAIQAMGGLDALIKRFQEIYAAQDERHQGGNTWIGTGGTSPFGAFGYNPEGIRIGQGVSRHKRAVKVWEERAFANLRDDVELETRQLKLALKRLRRLTRSGMDTELHLDQTIKKTSENAGFLDLQFRRVQENSVNILLLLDVGGSMDEYIERCSLLFSAARYEFKNLKTYYFHNCIYERLWTDNSRRHQEFTPTLEVLNRFNKDYKIIFVGDAAMSPYEITMRHGSVEHYNEEAGITWLERFQKQFPNMVWLNPIPADEWEHTYSIRLIKKFTKDKMFPLTLRGLEEAVSALSSS
ncbi:MAG: VWA domain-containing protein [Aureispira sp.]